MSQKKKLVLSPLPEQTDDYSRYEETETRWDRIIAALVLLVLIISMFVYFLLSNTDDEVGLTVLNSSVSEKQTLPKLKSESTATTPNQETSSDLETKVEEKIDAKIDAKIEAQGTTFEAKPSEVIPIEQDSPLALKKQSSEEIEAVVQLVKNDEPKTQTALVDIKKTSITKAVLTLAMKNDEPTASIASELVLPGEGIVKVILFTEMSGLRGKTLYHEWYRNGIRQARVKIPVNVKAQASHSSKYINAQMLGEWQVKVLDEKSELYVLADFRVVLP